MRRLYSLILICAAALLLLAPASAAQTTAQHQETFTVARPGTRVPTGSRAPYHQIAWNTSGGPGSCFLSLDYSVDGQVWYLGAAIPGHDCTQSGSTIIAGPQQVAFVRVNVNALSNGAAIRTTYSGYQTNPGGPTGSVTSVFGRTGAIQAATGDYSVAQITGAAALFSPAFQGQPTAPTPAPGDSSNLVATTAFVAQAIAACGCGGGPGGGAVTSVFTRTGAVTAATGDYNFSQISGTIASNQLASSLNLPGAPTAATAPVGTNTTQLATTAFVLANQGGGPGGGLSGSGGVNAIAKFTAATALGSSLLSDDGTTLNYTGSGGITTPKLTVTQGPFYLESVTGALPALPGAGKNALVSGTDGWYVSNANSPYFKIEPPGTGTGGAVASVFGRIGAVTATTGDYGVAQVTGAAPLASPVFTGTPTVPAPSGAAATSPGNNQVATTAFVFAHAGSSSGPGAITSVFGRQGAVVAEPNDYDVSQVSGAAPLASPALTGTPTSTPGPAGSDRSDQLATTAWVKNYIEGTGGGPSASSITHSPTQAPVCSPQGNAALDALTIPFNILPGDTVLVYAINSPNNTALAISVHDTPGNNTYQLLKSSLPGTNFPSRVLQGVLSATAASTSVTVQTIPAGKFVACVAALRGVLAFGQPIELQTPGAGFPSGAPATISMTTTDPNNVMVALLGAGSAITNTTMIAGTELVRAQTAAPAPVVGGALCEIATASPGPAACTIQASSGNIYWSGIGIELRCCAGVGSTPGLFPRVVAYKKANINLTATAAPDVQFLACSATDCPPGYYRVTWDSLSLTAGCSTATTNGTVIANVDYYDEYDVNNAYHTGIGSPSRNGPGRNHEYWSRLMTVARVPLPTTGTHPAPANTGINFTTSTEACPTGTTGTTQTVISVERLQ